jgi:hypothetical protein
LKIENRLDFSDEAITELQKVLSECGGNDWSTYISNDGE